MTTKETKKKKVLKADNKDKKSKVTPVKKAESVKSKKPLEVPKQPSNLIRWKAPDYYSFEKSPFWSLGVGLVAIAISSVLVYTNNYFPVIIVILAVIVTFQIAHEKPKSEEFAIDEGGILSRNTYLPYMELKSFWLVKNNNNKVVLYVEPIGALKAPITMPLGQQSSIEVRNFLLKYLPERLEQGEILSDKLIRMFRL